jgi:DNA-binding CsgD family transcriptional regulator
MEISAMTFHLTRRESDVLKLVASGLTIRETANALGVGFGTVAAYRRTLHLKTRSRNATELILWAIRNGVVTVEVTPSPTAEEDEEARMKRAIAILQREAEVQPCR